MPSKLGEKESPADQPDPPVKVAPGCTRAQEALILRAVKLFDQQSDEWKAATWRKLFVEDVLLGTSEQAKPKPEHRVQSAMFLLQVMGEKV